MSFIKTLKNNYVIKQVQKQKLPNFTESKIKRFKIHFKGRVQKVGFRLEVCEMSKRLNIVGYCRNLENGDVEAELQGENNKIDYLLAFMKSLKRVKIEYMRVEEISLKENETIVEKI